MMPYFRLSGGGNDFLAFADPNPRLSADQIRRLCRRGLSLGADGLFLVQRAADNGVRMSYFNSDGSPAALCLNGTRCAAQLACHLGWCTSPLRVETGAGDIDANRLDETRVTLALPRPKEPEQCAVTTDVDTVRGWRVDVGVPHFVLIATESLRSAPVERLGASLRSHLRFGEAGTNVDFVRYVTPQRFEIRTFERGVDAETLACGTGVLAAAAVGRILGRCRFPATALTRGGFLFALDHDADANRWQLTGDARLLAEGTLHPGAWEIPLEPEWS